MELKIETLDNQRLAKQVNEAMKEAYQNMEDARCDDTKKREVIVKIVMLKEDTLVHVGYTVEKKLQGPKPGITVAKGGTNKDGEPSLFELMEKQDPAQHLLPTKGIEEYEYPGGEINGEEAASVEAVKAKFQKTEKKNLN